MDSETAAGAPVVTVSLVVYNGLRWLPGCFDSLSRQTLDAFELLVVDNASTDGSLGWLRERTATATTAAAAVKQMSLTASEVNLGFAAAHNRNIYDAGGTFVCLLNQDVILDERFLERAVGAFEGRPRVGAVQGKLLGLSADGSRSNVIDSTGLVMHRSRRVVSRGQGLPDTYRWSVAGPVWGVDGPAPVYRRGALLDVEEPRGGGGNEVLDEDFFMYKEDVDLAWRLRRRGWSTWYEPSAVAWHARTAGVGEASSLLDVARSNWEIDPWIKSISWRNQRLMQIKNESLGGLVRDLPWILGRELASLAFIAAFDRSRLAAVWELAERAGAARRKRGAVNEP